jgi:hypothetical protein
MLQLSITNSKSVYVINATNQFYQLKVEICTILGSLSVLPAGSNSHYRVNRPIFFRVSHWLVWICLSQLFFSREKWSVIFT